MNNTFHNQANVLGAGLVGSLLSIFLARRGYDVTVFERRADSRKAGYVGGRSINLAMSRRGWKALERVGIAEQIRAVGLPMAGRMMHDRQGNLAYQAYGKADEAIFSVSRGGLNEALMNLAEAQGGIKFEFETSCEGYNLQTGEVSLSNPNKGNWTIQPELVFGTDGAFSALRHDLMRRPGFNYAQNYMPHGYKELTIPANADGSFKMNPDALHIWARGNFMLIALPNPSGDFTCTLFLPLEGEISFAKLNTDAEILAFFEAYFKDTLELIPNLLEDFRNNPTSTLITVHSSPWHYKNTVILGDAAHAIVPFYGQGMNCGFEDCTVLDDLMAAHGNDWDSIFKNFSTERIHNANAIGELAQRNFIEMRDKVADPNFLLWKKIAANLHQKFPTEFLPVYSMVSFSDIPYSECLKEDDAQARLAQAVLKIPNIQEVWDGEAVEQTFKEWLKTK